jgi:hypothetical protein
MTPLEGLDMADIEDSHLDSVLVAELRHGSSAAFPRFAPPCVSDESAIPAFGEWITNMTR